MLTLGDVATLEFPSRRIAGDVNSELHESTAVAVSHDLLDAARMVRSLRHELGPRVPVATVWLEHEVLELQGDDPESERAVAERGPLLGAIAGGIVGAIAGFVVFVTWAGHLGAAVAVAFLVGALGAGLALVVNGRTEARASGAKPGDETVVLVAVPLDDEDAAEHAARVMSACRADEVRIVNTMGASHRPHFLCGNPGISWR